MYDEPVRLLAVAQRIAVVAIPDDPLDRRLDRGGDGKIHVCDEGGQDVGIVLIPLGVAARLQRGLRQFEADRRSAGHDLCPRRFRWMGGSVRLREMAGDRIAIREFS